MQKIVAIALLALLAACSSAPPPPAQLQPVTGDQINLDVRTITFADRSGIQPNNSPYNSNDFHPTISESIRDWASSRLKAVGAQGDAAVIVKDASLISQPIAHADSMFTRAQTSKYVGHASVTIEIGGKGTGNYAIASAESIRFETLPDNPSAAERRNAYVSILNGIMQDLNRNLEASIRDHMKNYVITAPIINGTYGASPPPQALPAFGQ